jgi:hypothetical protein
VGALGGEGQQHAPPLQPEARTGLRLGERGGAAHRAEPLGHDVDLPCGRAEQLHEVAAGAVGDRDHAVRAARGERHQHAHAPIAQARVGLGEARVDQVVHGERPPKAPPRRRGAREAVHEVHLRARRQERQQRLLAEHPLLAPAGVDGDGDSGQQLAPRPARSGGGLAVDERDEARLRRSPQQRGDQLAGVDLHPAGLTRHEVDQVQADAHARRRLAPAARAVRVRGERPWPYRKPAPAARTLRTPAGSVPASVPARVPAPQRAQRRLCAEGTVSVTP